MISHLFSDPMSLVTHEASPCSGPSGETLLISLEITISDFFKKVSKVVSLHQTGDWESGSMVKCAQKHSTASVAFKVFFFAARIKIILSEMKLKPSLKQLNRAHA